MTLDKKKKNDYAWGMQALINILVSAIAVVASAYVLPGVKVDSFTTAVVVAIVLGVVNTFIKPVLVLLTLPITVVTLGLFLFVLNALIIIVVSEIVPGFKVDGFIWALIFSLVLSLVNSFLHSLT